VTAKKIYGLLVLFCLAGYAVGSDYVTQNPYKVEAAFLRNFAHYVTWPENTFSDSASPWNICVLGSDPFGKILETTLKNRTEQGRGFKVFRAESIEMLPSCQMVFIAYKDPKKRQAALNVLKEKNVLTVSDAPGFLREGGVIQFQVNDRVHMNINLDQARAVSLSIQTKMLEVSSAVLEDGVFRKMR